MEKKRAGRNIAQARMSKRRATGSTLPSPDPATLLRVQSRELTDGTIEALIVPYLTSEIRLNVDNTAPAWGHPAAPFFSTSSPGIDTRDYMKRVLRYAYCSRSAFIGAIILLRRASSTNPSLALTDLNLHRLFIAALVLATKALDDRVLYNSHYARVGGIASVSELNALEWRLLDFLNFRVFIYKEEYTTCVLQLAAHVKPDISLRMTSFINATYSTVPYEELVTRFNFPKQISMIVPERPCGAPRGWKVKEKRGTEEYRAKLAKRPEAEESMSFVSSPDSAMSVIGACEQEHRGHIANYTGKLNTSEAHAKTIQRLHAEGRKSIVNRSHETTCTGESSNGMLIESHYGTVQRGDTESLSPLDNLYSPMAF